MGEEKRVGGSTSCRGLSTFVTVGDRQVFRVELRPSETTIVSWKKLVKDSNKVRQQQQPKAMSATPPPPPSTAPPDDALEPLCVQSIDEETKDAPPTNRFSAVIEKIERLYMGKQSSDEEDLNDMPEEDQYDTEDSFIDDAELDEYFEVDNSATKHNGFFVNRGKLERISQPMLATGRPKKRKKEEMKGQRHSVDGNQQNTQFKYYNKSAVSTAKLFPKPLKPSEFSSPKTSEGEVVAAPASLTEPRDPETNRARADVIPCRRSKESSGEVSHERVADPPLKLQQSVTADDRQRVPQEKVGIGSRDSPVSNVKLPQHERKGQREHRREGSSCNTPRDTLLEKAIRELERMVAESRPITAMDTHDVDFSGHPVKRRLPREIKQKLAKVARIASAHGKISEDLINRLMSILGHLMQLRTLKKNLKLMITMAVSAKQEKDDRFQNIKKEVVGLVRRQVSLLKSKEPVQVAGTLNDIKDGSEGKVTPKRKFNIDNTTEDKICDLYDLYVDGLEDDTGPQIRKFYAELAGMWPTGFMDSHGIRRGICRAKARRKATYGQNTDQEKAAKRKMSGPWTDQPGWVDPHIQQPTRDRPAEAVPAAGGVVPPSGSNQAGLVRVGGLDRGKQEQKQRGGSAGMAEEKRVKKKGEGGAEGGWDPQKQKPAVVAAVAVVAAPVKPATGTAL